MKLLYVKILQKRKIGNIIRDIIEKYIKVEETNKNWKVNWE